MLTSSSLRSTIVNIILTQIVRDFPKGTEQNIDHLETRLSVLLRLKGGYLAVKTVFHSPVNEGGSKLKMSSAQHSSNNGKNYVTEKTS